MATYLSTRELASRIPYDERTIREQLKDSVLLEGVHYIRPFGRRRWLVVAAAAAAFTGMVSPPPHSGALDADVEDAAAEQDVFIITERQTPPAG